MEDGPRDFGDRIIWYKDSVILREHGPAVEFKDGRKLWALGGRLVTEQQVATQREECDRQAREQSDALWEQYQAEQLQQFHTGLENPTTVKKPLSFRNSRTVR